MRGHIDQKIVVGVVFVSAMFMSILDATIVNVALPTIGRDFHVPATAVDGVSIAFLVSLAVFIPASGWLGDRFGAKQVLLTAIVVFTTASMLCGIAQTLGELVFFRVLQGVGGGMLAPVGMAMLFRAYPPEERIRASSILMTPTTVAPALGPILGGILVTTLSWRWVFFVNLPIGIVSFVFGLLFLEGGTEHSPGRFDVSGFLLAGLGLGSLMYGVSEGPIKGWGSVTVATTIVCGLIGIAALVVVELRKVEPIIDLRLFKNRLFRSSNGVIFLTMAAFVGTIFTVTLFYQDGRGLSALTSGLGVFPEAIGVMLGAQLATRVLYPRLGPRRHICAGLLLMAVTAALMALIGPNTSLWWLRGLMFVLGVSMAGVFVPVQAAAFATISPAATGRGSTMFNALRQLGGAIGVAAFTSAIVAVGAFHRVSGHVTPELGGYHVAFLAAGAVALCTLPIASRISDLDAAATIVRRTKAVRPPAGAGVPQTVGELA